VQVDISVDRSSAPETLVRHFFIRRLTAFFVRLFERYTPDPYVLAVGLSILTAVLAALFKRIGDDDLYRIIRRVMGFTVMSFLLGTVLFGAALLILV
jgi:short subunit fatty acids transporter